MQRPTSALAQDASALDNNQKLKWLKERDSKKLQLRQVEASANNMQREIKHRAKVHASHIIQLKMQLTALQALVDENNPDGKTD